MRKECYTYWMLCLLLLALPQAGRAQRVSSGALVEDVSITRERDSVVIAFRFNLDKMHVESNRSVVLQPLLEGEKESQWLPAVEVMGRKRYIYYERNNRLTYAESPYRVVKKEKDASQQLPYWVALPYQPWMEGASLHLSEDQCGCGALIAHAQEPLAKADITYHPVLAYIAPQVETVKSRQLSGQAYLDFRVNKTDIDPDYRRNPSELAKIRATIDSVRNDNDVRIVRIYVKGYASPEGTYSANARLAEGRTEALKSYIIGRYALPDTLFSIASEPENWEGLREYVEASTLEDKGQILALIDSEDDADAKERQIRVRCPQSYRILLEDCYPGLRRSDYRIDYVIRGFNPDEAKRVIRTRPQNLSLQEMFAVAQAYPTGSPEFIEVFQIAVQYYPTDPVANLNAANALLEHGLAEQALPYLMKAGDTPQADNARGVAMRMLGRYDEAEKWLHRAAEAGLEEAGMNLKGL